MSPDQVVAIEACRSCGGGRLVPVFDLGEMPLADGFSASASDADPRYPLSVVFCEDCTLAQLRHTVAPEILFANDYPYFSSYSDTVVRNAAEAVDAALRRCRVAKDALAVELASNDGYLLQHARARGLRVLGIDPALGPVEAARERGIETVHAFFSMATAERVRRDFGLAELVFANNVLAHVADTRGFVRGIAALLSKTGTAVIEVPHLQRLIEKTAFDTIYHEHLCYFSLSALTKLFEAEGLCVTDVTELEIHGGSLRLFVQRRPAAAPTPALEAVLAGEGACSLGSPALFARLADDVTSLGRALVDLLATARREGASITAYGAAAKGTILLNRFGIDRSLVDYVADRNPHKHGLYVPGVKLPVRGVEALEQEPPDLLLILAWNHAPEIIDQLRWFAERGGRFVVPVPVPTVVHPS